MNLPLQQGSVLAGNQGIPFQQMGPYSQLGIRQISPQRYTFQNPPISPSLKIPSSTQHKTSAQQINDALNSYQLNPAKNLKYQFDSVKKQSQADAQKVENQQDIQFKLKAPNTGTDSKPSAVLEPISLKKDQVKNRSPKANQYFLADNFLDQQQIRQTATASPHRDQIKDYLMKNSPERGRAQPDKDKLILGTEKTGNQ